MDVLVTVEAKFTNHRRGLESMKITGDAPVVAEILRTVGGDGDLPAHPKSVSLDFLTDLDAGPSHLALRAYPIESDRWAGRRVRAAVARRLGERLLTRLGMVVEPDEPGDEARAVED